MAAKLAELEKGRYLMKSLVRLIPLLAVLPFALMFVAPAEAIVNEYVEDFFTTQYQDTLNTTALWDVVPGELKLPPYEPTLVGSCVVPGAPYGVAISGDYAYVTAYAAGGLQVIDTSDPTAPVLAGSYDTPGTAYGVAISGDHAYVTDNTSGLQVIDISDPTNPALAGNYNTPDRAWAVAISGDYAYVADGGSGLQVIDISDPTTPTLAGSCDTPGNAYWVAISGDYAYVTDQASGLQILDISDPTTPTLAGDYDTPVNATGAAISGDYAYIADQGSGLQVIDISDPTTPTLAGSCDTPGAANRVEISGDYAYVADYTSGLQIIDISDPTTPVLAGGYDTLSTVTGVVISGDCAYVADQTSGLHVIRIADPMPAPRAAGESDLSGQVSEPVIAGDYLYAISSAAAGIAVVDISDPTSPALAGSFATPGGQRDIAVEGDYAYVADGGGGFVVVDISDPTTPFSAGELSLSGWAKYVVVQGNYAYIGCDYSSQSFVVVDISDPTNPALAGYLSYGSGIGEVAVEGDYAFFGVGDLYSVDISDPTAPILTGSCATPGSVGGITIVGDYAYVADEGVGLQVIDISNPASPSIAGTCSLSIPSTYSDVAVSGDRAYVGDGSSGLRVVDISDPTAPVLLATYATTGNTYWPAVSGDYIYLGSTAGLHVAEILQSRYDTDADTGQSLTVDERDDSILWAKLTTTQVDSIAWELSSDGGGTWDQFQPDDVWYPFSSPGIDLLWRSTHSYVVPGVNPKCTDISIEWLCGYASIESIVDIGNDQGRQVRVSWQRSGHDYVGSPTPITEYAIYRRQDDLPVASGTGREPEDASRVSSRVGSADQPLFYPPGDWDFVGAVPACCEGDYAVVVPTLADSTIAEGMHYTTFFVRALTSEPGTYFDALPDSGYSIDNLAPGVPGAFAVNYTVVAGNELSWEASEAEDFQHFRIYCGDHEGFEPSPENLLHMTIDIAWVDGGGTPLDYYKISAVDYSGNESDPASPETVTGVDGAIPGRYSLSRNFPNPFNPTTRIAYDVPAPGGRLSLRIYAPSGRLVRTLEDRFMAPGKYMSEWDGKDGDGTEVGSGVYLYVLEAPSFFEQRKMVLLK